MKTQKEKEREAEHKKYHKFPDRSCNKCSDYPCFIGQDFNRCDHAKYGCKTFNQKDGI